jgi:hypothetical protein
LPFDDLRGGSDLHRACLTRLCCALRVSHPLDALIPPVTFRPCCMPVPSVGFLTFRGFPPPVAGPMSPPDLPSLPFPARAPELALAHPCTRPPRLRGLSHPAGPSHRSRCYPVLRWPILSWRSPPRGSLLLGLGLVLPRSLLSWAWARRWRIAPPSPCLLCRVSKNRGVGFLSFESSDLPEVRAAALWPPR